MSVLFLALAATAATNSPFEGHWSCHSALRDQTYLIELEVVGERSTATILHSNDEALPIGVINLRGSPQEVEKYGPDPHNIFPELRWDGQVTNRRGWMSFSLRWDDENGLFVSLWQYFSDRSPSRFGGELLCEEASA